MKKRIFIAGPVSAKTKKETKKNIERANVIAKKLSNEGNLVFVPQNLVDMFKSKEENKEYSLKLSKSILKRWATHIYLLKGWKESKGALEEYNYSKKNKLKIIEEK